MIPNADLTVLFELTHNHGDGSAHPMDPVHHSPAQHDPERSWGRGQAFRCRDCDSQVTLIPKEEA